MNSFQKTSAAISPSPSEIRSIWDCQVLEGLAVSAAARRKLTASVCYLTGLVFVRALAVFLLFLWFMLAINAEAASPVKQKLKPVRCLGCIISCDTGKTCEYAV